MKTLIIVSHPYPEQSTAIKTLEQAARPIDGVEVRNLETLYGHDTQAFDVVEEQKAAEAADRIVFLFPTHWFNLTPMLKGYLNQVWTHGWAFGPAGTALQGKSLQIVVTAGGTEHLYAHHGLIQSTIDEVLTPMKACAHYVGMTYRPPQAFLGVRDLTDARLAELRAAFVALLQADTH